MIWVIILLVWLACDYFAYAKTVRDKLKTKFDDLEIKK
jgi:hypothetical protein